MRAYENRRNEHKITNKKNKKEKNGKTKKEIVQKRIKIRKANTY